MDENLRRVFDQTRPTPEQKKAMLSRLLEPEKEEQPVKHVKRMVIFGLAAALMVITCTAAAVTGLDQRLAEYFGAGPEQEEWLAAAIAADEPVRHTYESGWTVQVGQVLADRYSVSVVMDFTAPESLDLAAVVEREGAGEFDLLMDFSIEDREGNTVSSLTVLPNGVAKITADGGRWLSSYEKWERYGNWRGSKNFVLLEDTDLERGHISILWTYYNGLDPSSLDIEEELMGGRVRLAPKGLHFWDTKKVLYFRGEAQAWTYEATLPDTDPGRMYEIGAPVQIKYQDSVWEMELQRVYLSPMGLHYDVYYDRWDQELCAFPHEREDYVLNLSDGSVLAMSEGVNIHGTGEAGVEHNWEFYHIDLRPEQLVNPAEVVSFTLFGQTFELN